VIVTDTNLLVYLYVRGERTDEAEAVLARDPLWTAPLLWRSEFRSAVAGLIRRGGLPLDGAFQIVNDAERFMSGREYGVVSHRVLQLATGTGCSTYDCEFVALAEDLGAPLVTSDREVLKAFPALTVTPEIFTR